MNEKPNFYAVIPADVRYDKTLRPNAKLLYAEIAALSVRDGCCEAQNDYFSKLYGLTRKTISELIGQLAAAGYIKVEILRDSRNQVCGRKLWLSAAPDPIPENPDTCPEKSGDAIPKNPICPPETGKIGRPSPEKSGDPIPKNREYIKENNINIKNINKNTASANVWEDYAGDDAELLAVLRDFEQMRQQRKKPMTSRAKKMLLNKLDKRSGGVREIKIRMLEDSILHCWDEVYMPKAEEPSKDRSSELEDW